MPEFTAHLQDALAPGYTLERELSGGGMSRVFVATDVALGRKVVVKVLPPELAAGVNHERFRREIQVAAQLQHPHIVPLLSAGERGTLIWYTMPFINGHSLRELLAKGDRQSVKDVVRIMRDVAEALDYAHGLGVIHRDIKPGNVLLMGSHALVTDFGVAKAISASMPSSGFTSAGMAIGTPAYMAPEQIAADPAADHRMDLYALGLLGYELLTGQVPFKEDSPQKTMAAQLTRDPSPVEDTRGDVPAPLSALVRRLLAKLPEERPQRASEVVAALDEIALTSGQHLAPLRPVARPSLGRTLAVAAVGVAVVGAAWLMGERSGAEAGEAAARDSVLAAESSAVVAAASMLTREDSMAIAEAVSARMAQRAAQREAQPPRAAPGATGSARPAAAAAPRADSAALVAIADSIRVLVQRAMLDSLVQLARSGRGLVDASAAAAAQAAAQAAGVTANAPVGAPQVRVLTGPEALAVGDGRLPPPPPAMRSREPRRVVVALPRPVRGRAEIDAVAAALGDSLQRALDAHPRYVVVAPDSVAAALRESRTVDAVRERLGADLIVSIALIPARDSIVRMVTVRDLAAPRGFNMRTVVSPVAAADPKAGVGELVPRVVKSLLDMERDAWVNFERMRTAPRPAARPEAPKAPDVPVP